MSRSAASIKLVGGETIPVLGQGTWFMGDHREQRREEIAALRLGIDLGLTLIDTAEMYGDGRAESLVGEAIAGVRERVFLVSKVLPSNASRRGVPRACEASLKRLKTDCIDFYLLHWSSSYPLADTIAGFEDLRAAGKIRYWGVSNFDVQEMKALLATPGGSDCAVNQVLYNLTRRGIEYELLPRAANAALQSWLIHRSNRDACWTFPSCSVLRDGTARRRRRWRWRGFCGRTTSSPFQRRRRPLT